MTKPITQLVAAFGSLHPHEKPAVGGFTATYRSMHPEDVKPLGDLVQALHQNRSLGRYSNPEGLMKAAGVAPGLYPTLNRMVDAYADDDLAVSIQKRMGTDADLPPAPLTSRDVIEAAFDNHQLSQQIHGE